VNSSLLIIIKSLLVNFKISPGSTPLLIDRLFIKQLGQDPEVGSDLATYFNTPKGGVG